MKHPSEIQLALFAGHDLGVWDRWRVGVHVSKCGACSAGVQGLQTELQQVKSAAAEMPDGMNWSRLSQEMTGNIRVGLAAGECIAAFEKRPISVHPRLGWHAAMVLACASVVIVVTLWLSLPKGQMNHLIGSLQQIRFDRIGKVVRGPGFQSFQDGIILEASPASIGITQNGGTMSLLQPRSQGRQDSAVISVSMQGSAGARYVDSDSGQVTTNRVYYAQ